MKRVINSQHMKLIPIFNLTDQSTKPPAAPKAPAGPPRLIPVFNSEEPPKKPTAPPKAPAESKSPGSPDKTPAPGKPLTMSTKVVRKSELPVDRRWLVELMRDVGFGTVNGLAVRQAQPQTTPRPKVVYSRRLGGRNEARPEKELKDFILKEPVVDLFKMFDQVQDGFVLEIVVRNGLPQEVKFEGLS